MEKNPNPNSLETYPSSSWSELPLDLLSPVFERLTFANFQRAKSVCSSWYSASRQSISKNQNPWLILLPQKNNNNNNNCCTLFNPEEKDKLYKTKDLGLEFANSVCVATCGNCLLMRDPRYNVYIVNLFTQERINIPPMESQIGTNKIERVGNNYFFVIIAGNCKESFRFMQSPVFWIDEKTKDYVVIWGIEDLCLVYSKKGDTSWKSIPETSRCIDLVYKDHKLYFLSRFGSFKIFDFCGEYPQETFKCFVNLNRLELGQSHLRPSNSLNVFAIKLVVTVTGDVLKVEKVVGPRCQVFSFRIYKVYSSHLFEKYERVESLSDEAMLFDLGVTVLANGLDGFKRNSIYFDSNNDKYPNEIFLFNLETKKWEQLHKFDHSSVQLSRAQWFLPSFTQTVV